MGAACSRHQAVFFWPFPVHGNPFLLHLIGGFRGKKPQHPDMVEMRLQQSLELITIKLTHMEHVPGFHPRIQPQHRVWRGKQHRAGGRQNPFQLIQKHIMIDNMLDNLATDNQIEPAIFEWQAFSLH